MFAVRRRRADCEGLAQLARLEGKAGQDELDEELDGMALGTTKQRADRLAGEWRDGMPGGMPGTG